MPLYPGIAEKAKGMLDSLKTVIEGHKGILDMRIVLACLYTHLSFSLSQSWEEHLLILVCMSHSRVPVLPSWTLEMHTS